MTRRGVRKLGVCVRCRRAFVTQAHRFLDGSMGWYHETLCDACKTERAVAEHLEAAMRLKAKIPAKRARIDRNAAKFADKHPTDVCERCLQGKSCSILSRERGPT